MADARAAVAREGAAMLALRSLPAVPALVAAASIAPSAAPAAPLIAPLDVRVHADVRPGTVLRGSWNASDAGAGAWIGGDLRLVETWSRASPRPLRIRGRRSGGPQRVHLVELRHLRERVGEGTLTEAHVAPGETPRRLLCQARGAAGPGEPITTDSTAYVQVVDQPRRNRVLLRGPGIAFTGPECSAGPRLPARTVGVHPPVASKPWIPRGALTRWEIAVPRAEFAAGGTFRFRGRYRLAANIQDFSTGDVFGTALTSGTVAVDVHVRRVGR